MSDNNFTYSVKKGDTGKVLYATLKDTNPATDAIEPYSIPNGSTVTLLLTKRGETDLKVNAACTILDQATKPGQITYQWQSADVDTPGEYDLEFRVTLPDTSKVHFPCEVGQAFGTVVILPSKL